MTRTARIPAMANAHSHAFQLDLRGIAERVSASSATDDFWSWRTEMYRLAGGHTPETMGEVGRRVYGQMAAAGYGAVGEFHYVHHHPDGTPYPEPNAMAIALAEAARAAGLEITLLPAAYHRGGWAGSDSPPAPGQVRFCDPSVQAFLERVDGLRRWAAGADGVNVGVAAHSVRAVPAEWLSEIARYAEEHGLVRHVHASEQRRELAECEAEHGCSPIELLARTGFLGPRTSVIHAIHVSERDVSLLAETDSIVVTCPTTEGNLGDVPDFQRGWVWEDERIRAVLASVSRVFPIGALMMLETGGETKFHPRSVEGVNLPNGVEPDLLVLDGQQRLTSLFQATTYGNVVTTMNIRKQPIKRWFYFDMCRALGPPEDREDAIIGVPEDKILRTLTEVKLDLSTREKEFENLCFPCEKLFDTFEWQNGYLQHWRFDPAKTELFMHFQAEVLQRFQSYQIPVIKLKKAVQKEAVCHVFEKVNTGGVVLNAFELLTATYAAENFRLRDDWYGSAERNVAGAQPTMATKSVLRGVQNTDFLQAVTLIHSLRRRQEDIRLGKSADDATGVSCKKSAVLVLPKDAYQTLRNHVLTGFQRAAKFLTLEHIFLDRDLPYQTQLVPLAAILAELGDTWGEIGTKQKVRQWYWCGVLGELYGGAVESRHARDLPECLSWIRDGGLPPTTVRDANFNPDRLHTLRTRNSAAYKGIYALLMQRGGREFLTDVPISFQTYEEEKIDIHHIFPKAWCKKHDIEHKRMDCVVNKTAISARTNRIIGGAGPSTYLRALEKRGNVPTSAMDAILSTHLISPEALRGNNFEEFFEARQTALLSLISTAMGKAPAVSAEPTEPTGEPVEDEDDTDDDMEIGEAA